MSEKIEVSVISLVYNHGKYLRKTLDGFVMQETNFKFEVLIHDDASTDDSADIIREYSKRYPDIIKPIIQTENQFQKGYSITENFLLSRIKGKYVAFCEGDDYWSSPHKLQKQYDIMEAQKECSICVHKTDIIQEDGGKTGRYFPAFQDIQDGLITGKQFVSYVVYTRCLSLLQFQLSSVFIKTEIYMSYFKNHKKILRSFFDVGDLPLFIYCGMNGNAYYINCAMSCYREGAIGSWSSHNSQDLEKKIKHLYKEIDGLQKFDEYSKYYIHESVEKGVEQRQFAVYRCQGNINKMKTLETYYYMLPRSEIIKINFRKVFPHLYNFLKKLKKIK